MAGLQNIVSWAGVWRWLGQGGWGEEKGRNTASWVELINHWKVFRRFPWISWWLLSFWGWCCGWVGEGIWCEKIKPSALESSHSWRISFLSGMGKICPIQQCCKCWFWHLCWKTHLPFRWRKCGESSEISDVYHQNVTGDGEQEVWECSRGKKRSWLRWRRKREKLRGLLSPCWGATLAPPAGETCEETATNPWRSWEVEEEVVVMWGSWWGYWLGRAISLVPFASSESGEVKLRQLKALGSCSIGRKSWSSTL